MSCKIRGGFLAALLIAVTAGASGIAAAAAELGPCIDPNGVASPAASDLGPGIDPDGSTKTVGATLDPNG
jgi:hypothetical protein